LCLIPGGAHVAKTWNADAPRLIEMRRCGTRITISRSHAGIRIHARADDHDPA
jgi:hypothetical protein